MNRSKIIRILYIIIGTVAVVLGAVGLILPILPTTPFLLLACFCYLRSSKKLYDRLMNNRVFGTYIYNYVTYKAITKKTKVFSVILLWSSLTLSIILVSNLHIRLLLMAVGVGVTIHLVLLRTIAAKKDEEQSSAQYEEVQSNITDE